MIQPELIRYLIAAMEHAEIPYMLTGSVAGNALGHPRTTHDIDVVVEISFKHVQTILSEFPPSRFYLSESAIREAIAQDGMFNAIDEIGVGKIDFWTLKDQPLHQRAFSRRVRVSFLGTQTWVPRPEDLILLKLQWAKSGGGSQKQMEDCAAILKFHRSEIDLAENDHWAMRLGLSEQWKELRSMAGV